MTAKLCANCKWVSPDKGPTELRYCLSPVVHTDLVTGRIHSDVLSCQRVRYGFPEMLFGQYCGRDAKLFEPNEAQVAKELSGA